jgi:hypothetical protein
MITPRMASRSPETHARLSAATTRTFEAVGQKAMPS